MTKSTGERELPKAYLRLDPDIDSKHPDNGWNYIRLLCAANRQRPRGYFHSRETFLSIFGKTLARTFFERGDVEEAPGGKVYVCGWGVWQEGDLTVAERVSRIRSKRDGVTPVVTPGEEPPALPSRYMSVTQPLPSRYPPSTVLTSSVSTSNVPRENEGVREEEPVIEALSHFYTSLSRDLLAFADQLVDEYGQEWTARAIGEAGLKGRDRLLSRAKTILLLWSRDRDKEEAAAERQRLAEKRKPVVIQPKPEETPEERERRETAFAKMRDAAKQIGIA
jgi:hypothetical protein